MTTTAEYRASLREEVILDAVLDACRRYGWLVHHDRPARTKRGWRTAIQGDSGFPDVVAVRAGRCVVVECKRAGQRPRADQAAWLAAWGAVAGAEVYVWTPLDVERVEAVFR